MALQLMAKTNRVSERPSFQHQVMEERKMAAALNYPDAYEKAKSLMMALLMMVGKCLPNTIKMGVHIAARKKELGAIS